MQFQHYNFIDVFCELLLFGYFENGSAPEAVSVLSGDLNVMLECTLRTWSILSDFVFPYFWTLIWHGINGVCLSFLKFEGGFLERLYALIRMWDVEEWEPAAEQYFTVLIVSVECLLMPRYSHSQHYVCNSLTLCWICVCLWFVNRNTSQCFVKCCFLSPWSCTATPQPYPALFYISSGSMSSWWWTIWRGSEQCYSLILHTTTPIPPHTSSFIPKLHFCEIS